MLTHPCLLVPAGRCGAGTPDESQSPITLHHRPILHWGYLDSILRGVTDALYYVRSGCRWQALLKVLYAGCRAEIVRWILNIQPIVLHPSVPVIFYLQHTVVCKKGRGMFLKIVWARKLEHLDN